MHGRQADLQRACRPARRSTSAYRLEVKNPGGHSSLPRKDNAIYRLADGLGAARALRLSRSSSTRRRAATSSDRPRWWSRPDRGRHARHRRAGAPIPAAVAHRLSPARSTTRCCAPPASPRSSRAGTPSTRCRSWRARPSTAACCRASRRRGARRRWCACSPMTQITVTPGGASRSSPPSPLHPELMRAIETPDRGVLARHPGDPDHDVCGRHRRQLPAQRRHPDLRPLRAGRRHRRRPRARQGRARARQVVLDGQEYLYRLVKALSSESR